MGWLLSGIAAIGLIGLVSGIWLVTTPARFQRSGVYIDVEITKIEEGRYKSNRWETCFFTFTTENGETINANIDFAPGTHRVRDVINIRYLRNNPQKVFTLASPWHRMGYLFIILGIAVLLWCVMMLRLS